jgi:hypothetical protein
LDGLADRKRRRKLKHDVDMILETTDLVRRHPVHVGDVGEVRPDPALDVGGYPRLTTFRAEYNVEIER